MVAVITWHECRKIASKSDQQLAEHHATSAQTLDQLASSTDAEVRTAVADNKNAHLDTIMRLTGDSNADLRYAMAENHNLAPAVLHALVEDTNPFVSHRARKTLARLAQEPSVPNVKSILRVIGHRLMLRWPHDSPRQADMLSLRTLSIRVIN